MYSDTDYANLYLIFPAVPALGAACLFEAEIWVFDGGNWRKADFPHIIWLNVLESEISNILQQLSHLL